jgi:hypothetical protein
MVLGRRDLVGRATAVLRSGLPSTIRSRAGRNGAGTSVNGAGNGSVTVAVNGAGTHGSTALQAAGAKLRALLQVADAQDEEAGRAALLLRAVDHLVPDEARILRLLGTRTTSQPAVPLVHIFCLTGTGLPGEPLLENASTVGRTAGVSLPQLTPHYVARLLELGLVEIGPEDERLVDDYRALLADPAVLAAMSRARDAGTTPRVIRHTLALSQLGHQLCAETS